MPEGIDFTGLGSVATKEIGSIGKRVVHQLPKNPRDRCTIVSIYPREIIDVKPTLFPGRFVIPAAEIGDFSILVVEGSSYYLASRIERQPPTEIQVNSAQLAESIIKDSVPSMNLVSSTRRPGVFWIPGEYNRNNIRQYVHEDGKTFSDLLNTAKMQQQEYFTEVVNEADYFWAASNGNPKTIPQDAKLAAKIMGLEKHKPWMANLIASELSPCPACGEMINKVYPVCKFCHNVIDKDKAKALDLVFAVDR